MTTFNKKYDHNIESEIYKLWIDNNLFEPNHVHSLQQSASNAAEYIYSDENFAIPLPPPNVTGSLHVGHALVMTIEDILIRYNRMSGRKTLWIPWTDHAGIATQAKVEWILSKKWITKSWLGRAKFLDEVWNFATDSRKEILSQLKKLGGSLDRSREQFSLSEKLSRAVRKSFGNLHKDGRIYRDTYITNRCPSCQTVISDIEVVMKPTQSVLYYIRYFLEWWNGSIDIATVRPETLFWDVAIAVNPKDPRFTKMIGKKIVKPLTLDLIPIVGDSYVEIEFGTGALKITPAHDANDYDLAKRHNLPTNILAIDKNWNFTDILGHEFVGKSAVQYKDNIITILREKWSIIKEEDYEHNVPCCERCGTIIEPMVSEQWFVNVSDVALQTCDAVTSNTLKIFPSRFESQFTGWLQNIRPWCISRQLWRWHRIPIWHSSDWQTFCLHEDIIIEKINKDNIYILTLIIFNLVADGRLENPFEIWELIDLLLQVSLVPQQGKIYQIYTNIYQNKFSDNPDALLQIDNFVKIMDSLSSDANDDNIDLLIDMLSENIYIKSIQNNYLLDIEAITGAKWLKQDSDVLDTWFSSGLWPMTTLGRPDNTSDFNTRYPQSILTTGYEIIFTRVARMCILGLINTKKLPFREIFFNGIVRDEKWIKMSKSIWNVVDPNKVISQIWADSLRLSVVMWISPGGDSNYSTTKTDYCSRFINKLWNASRFVYMNTIDGKDESSINYENLKTKIVNNVSQINDFDWWILQRLNKISNSQEENISKYQIWEYVQDLINFVWHDFCDRYIEISKLEKSEYTHDILIYILWSICKLLHPYIPFVTEKLWSQIWFEGFLIIQPIAKSIAIDHIQNNYISILIDMISEFRNLRSKNNIKNHELVDAYIYCNSEFGKLLRSYEDFMKTLIKIGNIDIYIWSININDDEYESVYILDNKIWIKVIKKEFDVEAKILQLQKEIEVEKRFLSDIEMLLMAPGFTKAPEDIIQGKKQKAEEIKTKISNLDYEISKLKIIGKN